MGGRLEEADQWSALACATTARGTIEEDIAVAISPDIEAQILRYYHAERWRVGTIAKQLRVHRDTVARVLISPRTSGQTICVDQEPSLINSAAVAPAGFVIKYPQIASMSDRS